MNVSTPVFLNSSHRQFCHCLDAVPLVRILFVVRGFPYRTVHDTQPDCSFIELGADPSDLEAKSLYGT
jgi:hypothetical protein